MIVPVILSGGSGTRLWPLSRSMYPKQFIRFFNGEGRSLLGSTLQRLGGDESFAAPIVVCNNDHRFLVREELARAGLEPQAVMLEPIARNTAAAVAAAALFDEPHTGYGYIRQGAALNGADGGFAVDEFREKPDRAKAEGYLAAGGYFWNSGIFVLSARAYLAELERLDPAIFKAARDALQDATQDMDFLRLDQTAFAASPNISIDYAVMEKTKAAAMLPLDVGWNDVGSWSSLWDIAP